MIPEGAVCPVEPGAAAVHGARLGQFVLVSTIAAACALHGFARHVLVGLLVVDLCVKGFVSFKHAPLAMVARVIVAMFRGTHAQSKPANAGPKRFAARVGLSFALGMLACNLTESPIGFYSVAMAFGAAALLDATTGLCIACILYTRVQSHR